MESGSVYGSGSNLIALLENSSNNSVWVPSPSPCFRETMVNFDHNPQQLTRPSPKRDHQHSGDDTGEEEFELNPFGHQPEKKRRLSPEQVQFLEKSFEVDNKLEPERKVQLARELGLQPRQVAIWFQNRRARYKTKQLEKEFGSLKASYDRLKVDFDSLSKEKDNLQNEVNVLTKLLMQSGKGKGTSFDHTPDYLPLLDNMDTGKVDTTTAAVVPNAKQSVEDANSAKSDVVDSESPLCTDGNHSSAMEDHVDQPSEFSLDEEEHMMINKSLLLPATPPTPLPTYNNFLKVDDAGSYGVNAASSCNLSLVDDQQPYWSWLY